MVQNNKVLTVSYGTFSCTLEGFEDSFDTMKAIAEYFRDLAADDRYFGAEPPQPDADMLARIAQREISRQVEARQSDQGIVLRAAEPAPVAAPVAAPVIVPETTEVAQQDVAAEPTEAAPEQPEEDTTAEAAVIAQEKEEAPVAEAAPEADDETLESAAEEIVPEIEESLSDDTEEAIADEHVPEAADETVAAEAPVIDDVEEEIEAEADETEAEAEDYAAAALDDDVSLAAISARVADPAFEPEVVEAEPVEEEPEIVPAADSIAAKLQRIRAVVSRNEQAAAEEADYSEDEHAEDLLTDSAAATEEEVAADASDEDEAPASQEDSILARVDEVLATDAVPQDAEADKGTTDETDEDDTAEDITEDGEDDALFADLDDEDDEDADDELNNILEEVAPRASSERPAIPRIVKVKKADLEAILEQEAEQAEQPTGSLSPEDEADLMRELAEVEAELGETPADAEAADVMAERAEEQTPDTAAQDAAFGDSEQDTAEEAPEAPHAEADDDDLSRLMATADEKLDDPDLSTNRETYSHMRAAVAAAQAERSAGGTVGMHSSDDEYRDDLAQAVRPRRPVASGARSRPRGEDRPAPLKLVAEQRIDTPTTTEQRGPIRPRRVANLVQDEAEAGSQGSFAEFAAENGAVSLPDLLEAAAAYMSFVEGRDQFSRPQLMNKVRQLDNQNFNREDGLRSFGQLLRDGKIKKMDGGRFTASGQIGYRPDSRAAG